jgi:hypothetical protein
MEEANVAGRTVIGDPGALIVSGVRQVHILHCFAVASHLRSEPGIHKFRLGDEDFWDLYEDAWGTGAACSLQVHVRSCSHVMVLRSLRPW